MRISQSFSETEARILIRAIETFDGLGSADPAFEALKLKARKMKLKLREGDKGTQVGASLPATPKASPAPSLPKMPKADPPIRAEEKPKHPRSTPAIWLTDPSKR